jgi:hypothetical protein
MNGDNLTSDLNEDQLAHFNNDSTP